MRAVLIHKADGPDAITVGERPVRQPGPGEVLLRVLAAAVNPADIVMWRTLGGGSVQPPFTAGMDAAGVAEAVGPGVDHIAAGQRAMAAVFPRHPEGGAQAELVVVPAASVVPIPEALDSVAASTLPMNGLTALEGLHALGLPPGATLAITGGAGLLASYAIPLAKQAGLRVIADAARQDADLVASFGTDVVVPRGDGFNQAVRQAAPGGADGLLDTAALTEAVVPAIRDRGVIAVVRGWNGPGPERGIQVSRVSVGNALQNTDWLRQLADHAAAGRIRLRVAGVHAPEAALDGYLRMEAGGLRGRTVIAF
ncbi:NADP-dependent oxidoreductase [Streptomyces sp. NPDC002668]|uniref:quinone oxidoreductase family protein n=1 Tax=Streptomyces sp. NPDC002668 TaxID=3154422 RepID=UPI003316C4E3